VILRVLLPYLKEKRNRAELGIELSDLVIENKFQPLEDQQIKKRADIARRIKAFNQHLRSEEFVLTA
jgi:2-methylisocitrate lyase-like PEP mutase family enzyme